MKTKNRYRLLFSLVLGLQPAIGLAITADVLQSELQAGESLTLIDIRPQAQYRSGHIPGAINIPAALVPHKKLPPLGRVIVYGDGIDAGTTIAATQQLNTKTGIQAEQLEGGIGAWDTLNLPSTQGRGMHRAAVRQLSYAEVKRAIQGNPEAVLVDLRQGQAVSSLQQQFPQGQTIKPSLLRSAPRPAKGQSPGPSSGAKNAQKLSVRDLSGRGIDPQRLYILVDDGDGRAERMAKRLRAAGVKRVTVLAGGERILRRGGQSGLKTEVIGGQQ